MENEEKSEKGYIICLLASFIVGFILLSFTVPLLNSLPVRETFELTNYVYGVDRLVCTSEEVPFDIQQVQSYHNETVEIAHVKWHHNYSDEVILISLRNGL